MWETWVRSLGWEDPLEKGKATHSGILAWRIPWTAGSGATEEGLTSRGGRHLRLPLRFAMDYTVYGILQARILEWVALPFSRGSF